MNAPTHVIGDPEPVVATREVPVGDTRLRNTDMGNSCFVDGAFHAFPDIRGYQIGAWAPTNPAADPFAGVFVIPSAGEFFRIDLVLSGFYNPPGFTQLLSGVADAFAYGENPVFGFIEFDMDANIDTGGELDFPEFRYIGNICRFGGLPLLRPVLSQRAAKSQADISVPFGPIHRSGEEFHLALFGDLVTQIDYLAGNNDERFEPGEMWRMTGEFFHRAHGYEPFSLAAGGQDFGVYAPTTSMLFWHDIPTNWTLITLVFPLTNEGAAHLISAATTAEPLNGNPSDQASILEALDDLQISADFFNQNQTGDPRQAIINGWLNQAPDAHLNSMSWDITVAVATACENGNANELLVWTDMMPNAVRGDYNGDSAVNLLDCAQHNNFIQGSELSGADCDPSLDGNIFICDFAYDFSLYDFNYNGVINELDREPTARPGDISLDCAVDLVDFLTFAACFGLAPGDPTGSCPAGALRRSDLNGDNVIDLVDLLIFAGNFTG